MVNIYLFLLLIYITQNKIHDRGFEFPILSELSIPRIDQVKTLMSTFYDKKNYTLQMLNYLFIC